ncbi:zinc ribbon domain-containing protein [Salinirubellus salinus]|uniref:Zinc ribbon domain-containing protein n=1 Tax=Salinirubellus salinus TaxID=1364945 RepID=A0A9E7R6S3_9EURY|nr:zinc ribbon domain-containing protein [Salinirubellus salinus]UWM56602.1 zinc ribbon domain-containing protein [Salinirubellus salinus]
MHTLVQRLVLGGRRSDPYVECRDCGTTLSPPPVSCPSCGSDDAVHYDLS